MHRTKLDEWCRTNNQLVHPSWDAKLFSRPYDEIVKYIKNRFETTLCEPEYYFCMANLTKCIESDKLYVYFKDSPQHKNCIEGTNTLPSIESNGMRSYASRTVAIHNRNRVENMRNTQFRIIE